VWRKGKGRRAQRDGTMRSNTTTTMSAFQRVPQCLPLYRIVVAPALTILIHTAAMNLVGARFSRAGGRADGRSFCRRRSRTALDWTGPPRSWRDNHRGRRRRRRRNKNKSRRRTRAWQRLHHRRVIRPLVPLSSVGPPSLLLLRCRLKEGGGRCERFCSTRARSFFEEGAKLVGMKKITCCMCCM